MTLRKKIFIFIGCSIALVLILFGIFSVGYLYNFEYNESVERLQTISQLKTAATKSYIADSTNYINSLAASSVFRDYLKSNPALPDYEAKKLSADQRLARTLTSNSALNGVFLINPTGVIVLSTRPTDVGKDVSDQAFFLQAKDNAYLKESLSTLSAPIKDDTTGELLGIIVLQPNPDQLIPHLQITAGLGATGETFIIDQNGYFLTASKYLGPSVILTKQISTANTKACFNPNGKTQTTGFGDVSFFDDYRGVPSMGTNAYISETGWCLITKMDQSEFYAPVYNLVLIATAAILVAIAAIGFSIWLISSGLVRSIKILKSGIETVEGGNLDFKVGTQSKDEIGELSRSFDNLVNSVKKSRAEVDMKVAEQTKEILEKSADMENQQAAILNILEDVEEEKNETSRERDKMNVILQSIGDAVFVTDAKLNITLVNGKALEISGLASPADVLGKNFTESFRFANESDINIVQNDFIQRAITEGKVTEIAIHTVLVKKNGTVIVVADSCAPLKDKNGAIIGCVVVFRDVTRERTIDKMKSEFVSLSSHQLRTPLTAVKWGLETVLGGEAGPLNDKQKEYLTDVNTSNEREIELVNSLLNVSRIESGRIIITPQPTNIVHLANDVIARLKVELTKKAITLLVNAQDNLPEINLDVSLISNVYQNLITNSIYYSPHGSKITLTISANDKEVISSIKDEGIGIPEDEKARVFERFYRASNAIKERPDGNGLGLYIVKSIVESSGGKIWFESVVSHGTTFYFSLPLTGMKAKEGEVSLT